MVRRGQRQLRNYLLDRSYQLRVTSVMVLLSAALTAGIGSFWYAETRTTSSMLEVEAITSGKSAAEVQALDAENRARDRRRLGVLLAFGMGLALLLTVSGIVMTHKVAGPAFKMRRYMAEIRDGRLGRLSGLRKGDQLQELWDAFREMHTVLRRRAEADLDLLDRTIAAAEALAGVPGAEAIPLDDLRAARERKAGDLRAGARAERAGEAPNATPAPAPAS